MTAEKLIYEVAERLPGVWSPMKEEDSAVVLHRESDGFRITALISENRQLVYWMRDIEGVKLPTFVPRLSPAYAAIQAQNITDRLLEES